MERNNQMKELIVKYLVNELSEEEDSLIVEWIKASEENRRYFNDIKEAWQLTAIKLTQQVNEEAEWDVFKQHIAARETKVVTLDEYAEEERVQFKRVIYRRIGMVAAAVAAVLVIALGWNYFFTGSNMPEVITKTDNSKDEVVKPVLQHEINTTGKEKNIKLADGSVVVLFNNSELIFEKPFVRRNIKLIGKALFRVAKDVTKPFTVESGAIATTALGTEFTVTAFAHKPQLLVRLYEGKVVIKPTEQGNSLMKNDVFLIPGEEFVYGPDKTLVRSFKTGQNQTAKEQMAADNPSLPVNAKGSWHMYNNQALSKVFDHLAAVYNVTILYDEKDVQKKYFVGQFKTTDSIATILNLITKANKLKYTREDHIYIIHQ
ncbi:FecR family protein [Niastella sp. OAS944]|uniref:FecR family protein n=1 Tax=Niastella sp. OAS944 TaxID=2664089 RepID=UPI0034723E0C|nr:ferric-dicitrate binding protein FerR (iron transport regulator) [Chitinophagaceae bacterium OAS944]